MDTTRQTVKRIIAGTEFCTHDTVLITCGSKRIRGILLEFGTDKDTWGRVIETTKISKLIHWKNYPYKELPYINDDNEFDTEPVIIKHERYVLIEKNIVGSFDEGLDNHINDIATFVMAN